MLNIIDDRIYWHGHLWQPRPENWEPPIHSRKLVGLKLFSKNIVKQNLFQSYSRFVWKRKKNKRNNSREVNILVGINKPDRILLQNHRDIIRLQLKFLKSKSYSKFLLFSITGWWWLWCGLHLLLWAVHGILASEDCLLIKLISALTLSTARHHLQARAREKIKPRLGTLAQHCCTHPTSDNLTSVTQHFSSGHGTDQTLKQ